MSIPIPNVDLSAAVVGSTGIIDLSRIGVGAGGVSSNPATFNNPSHLWMFNDSGCTLTCTFGQTGNGFKLPAGGWTTVDLPPGEFQIKWLVDFVLTNAPINLLMSTYYAPNENLPQAYTLGNSPIGGAVQATGGGVVTADHLINTGNAGSSSPIINITETGATGPQIQADNQGNLLVQQYVSNVLTTIFRTIAGAANNTDNVLISDLNHQAEVLGRLLVDGITNLGLHVNLNGILNGDTIAALIPGFSAGGGVGFQTNSSASDTGFTSFWAQHTGAGPGNPQNSYGYSFSGDALAAFRPDINPFSSANGSVSGQLQVRTAIWGTGLKIAWVWFNGLNTASNVTVNFPTVFNQGFLLWMGDVSAGTTCSVLASGVVQGCRQVIFSTVQGTGGTSAAQTVLRPITYYTCLTNIVNQFQCQTTGGAGINNGCLLIGS